jgi:predicted nucleotidyltransferase
MTRGRWWYPDTGFEPEHLAHAREFVDGLAYRDRVVAALATGSRAAGLAHARSDLDILVVLETEDDRGRFRTYPERHRGMTVDTDTLALSDVKRLLDDQRARETARVLDRGRYALANLVGWMRLVRLTIGHVVTATPTARTLLAGFDRDGVRRSVMVHATMCLATFAEDAKGAIECGDLATAVAASEQAVRFGVEASLTAFDDVYIGPKYLLRRMARHESLAALLEWDEMWGQPGVSCRDDEVTGLVHRRLLLAGRLAGHAMTTAFRRPVTAFPPFVPRDLGPVRDPFLVVVRWPGGTGLMTGVDMVRSLSEDAAVLWSLLDGRPVEEAVDEFARTTGRAVSEAAGYVRGTVDEWRHHGLVHETKGNGGGARQSIVP